MRGDRPVHPLRWRRRHLHPKGRGGVTHFLDIPRYMNQIQQLHPSQTETRERDAETVGEKRARPLEGTLPAAVAIQTTTGTTRNQRWDRGTSTESNQNRRCTHAYAGSDQRSQPPLRPADRPAAFPPGCSPRGLPPHCERRARAVNPSASLRGPALRALTALRASQIRRVGPGEIGAWGGLVDGLFRRATGPRPPSRSGLGPVPDRDPRRRRRRST